MSAWLLTSAVLGVTSSPLAVPTANPGLDPAGAGRWFAGLLLVLAFVLLCLWGLKRLNRWSMPAGGQIRLLGGLPLGGREKLLIVEIGETQLILGVSPGRVQTLHVLEGDRRLKPARERSFADQLQRAIGKGKA